MSGFMLIFQRNGAQVPTELASLMLARLAHRGPDGSATIHDGDIFVGCQHFWTTPEDVGECQPLVSADGRYVLAFDGRVDNRGELIRVLGLPQGADTALSDGALVLAAVQCWRRNVWSRLIGPFACVLYDRSEQRVTCARDPLGDRTLCTYVDDAVLLVASEPQAILVHPSVSAALDEITIAGLFTWTFSRRRTLFREIHEVQPGSTLNVDRVQITRRDFWSPDDVTSNGYNCDAAYAAEYGRLMRTAVRGRLRANGRAAMKLSGGLDSSAVAALWAAEQGNNGPVPTYSWIFDEFPACDERTYIGALSQHWGLDTHFVNGDDAWPLRGVDQLSVNPNQPDLELFRGLQAQLHGRMAADDVRVALTGYHGDDLYLGDAGWFASLIAAGRWRTAWAAFNADRQDRTALLRQLGSALLGRAPMLRPKRSPRLRPCPDWLTPKACELLAAHDRWHDNVGDKRQHYLFNPRLAWFSSLATYFDAHHGIEERYPFRDRRLIEFMLTIPAHQLRRMHTRRFVLRNAMREYWPQRIVQRKNKTGLGEFAVHGLVTHERAKFLALLRMGKPFWAHYVKPTWMTEAIKSENHRRGRGPELWVPWVCVALTTWLHSHHPDHLA